MEKPDLLDMLVVAPHPDDAELGMGGAILKMLQLGWKVGILDLTDGEPTPHGSLEIRAAETEAATRILRVPWRENLGLRNRFLEPTLEARAKLANVFRRVRPRWIFAPYWEDAHPDHVAATHTVLVGEINRPVPVPVGPAIATLHSLISERGCPR